MDRLVTTTLLAASLLMAVQAKAQAISAQTSAAAVASGVHDSSAISSSAISTTGPSAEWHVAPANSQQASPGQTQSEPAAGTTELLIVPPRGNAKPIGKPVRADGRTFSLFRDPSTGEVFLEIKDKAGNDIHPGGKVVLPGAHKAYWVR